MSIKTMTALAAFGACLLAAPAPARANTIVLTFEGVASNSEVGNFYDGDGGAAVNYGISFGSNALGLIGGNFANEPSATTILYFLSGSGAYMDIGAGFDTGFSFYYAASQAGVVNVYSGLDGTGTLLASLNLSATPTPYTVWDEIGVTFDGTARSVEFGGAANFIGFDNITLGSGTAVAGDGNAVPEPASLALCGVAAIGALRRGRRSKK